MGLSPAIKRPANPVVMPGDFVPTRVLGDGGRDGDNLLISVPEGNEVKVFVSWLNIWDSEPYTFSYFDRLAIMVPSAMVSILKDPLAGSSGIILTHLDELMMYVYNYWKRFGELQLLICLILLKTQIINLIYLGKTIHS